MYIKEDNVEDKKVINLIKDHINQMEENSPPHAHHQLDLDDYHQDGVKVWTVWEEEELLGLGALKEIDSDHGELKSIKTHPDHLRKGVAQYLVGYITRVAIQTGYERISLETGSQEAFKPAISFYESLGFKKCGPFDGYVKDDASIFMTQFLEEN